MQGMLLHKSDRFLRGGDHGVGGGIDRQMKLPPAPRPPHTILVVVPLGSPVDLQTVLSITRVTRPAGRAVAIICVSCAARRLIGV